MRGRTLEKVKFKAQREKEFLTKLRRWSVKTANNFVGKVDSLLGKLETFKHLCPASENAPNLRRCVVIKQTSLIYEVNDDIIEIVAFFDNRSKKS